MGKFGHRYRGYRKRKWSKIEFSYQINERKENTNNR